MSRGKKSFKEEKELKYYGIQACLFLFKYRSKDIVRVYLKKDLLPVFKPMLKWCADNKKAYHIVENMDLDRLTDSVHHEGVCVLAKERKIFSENDLLKTLDDIKCILYLDGIENPHNLGSIIRTAAHFGVKYIIADKNKIASLSPSSYRVAKGGAELVDIVLLQDPEATLQKLKTRGFFLVGTTSHKGKSLFQFSFPEKTVLVMGSESKGISKKIFSCLQEKIQIPGTCRIESLNVSVATSICLSEYFKQQGNF